MAGCSQSGGELKMEGWLYIIRSNRIGLQYSRKRYFVLEAHLLNCFKSMPISSLQESGRSAIIDSSIRVTDNGRESIHRKVFFIFTLYNSSNHNDQLKLGASSPEEAARWIHSFQEAALKGGPRPGNDVACSKSRWQSFRLSSSSDSNHNNSIDWTLYPTTKMDRVTSDVVAPSPWTIFGCQDGLRLFKEAKDRDSHGKWDDHPAIMAVGVVDGTSEAIFQTLMSLGPSRSEWDFCFYKGSVVEHLDGHTDIVHKQLYSDWLPWGMKRRDLLLRRYWRREDDGTYVILYHSVVHKKCPPQKSYVRASLKSGGYVISPVTEGKHSVVKHMLAIDWKFWKSYLRTSAVRSITIRMLERVAALRELFKAKQGNYPTADLSSGELMRNVRLHQSEEDGIVDMCTEIEAGKTKENMNEAMERASSEHSSLVGLNDAADEFFDVPEPTDHDRAEDGWASDFGPGVYSQDTRQPKLSTAAVFVKKIHDLAVQKRGYMDLQDMTREDGVCCSYGNTLSKDPTCTLPCSWTAAEPSTFLIRGKNYLEDRKKFKAKGTLMQMVAADWLRSDKREDDLGGRPGGIVQKYAARGGPEFFFIVNIQVPGSTTYSLALYYMMNTTVEDSPLLHNFVNGDDAYRNSRFKLIPYISKVGACSTLQLRLRIYGYSCMGSWIVKQSVGKKACLIGHALEMNYFHGKNYLELGIDIGSSTVARGVVNLVLGYLNNLVIEMAFLIQANTEDELPEYLLGTCRLNHLDAAKSVPVKV
ncbi:protein ENHANCED DISEASE RESISTANCE 2-like isoform X1 [Gossypium australe]|uniref:Protein ENHANCED DISEASE RESISTANCE 2-like isoform X1 n=1 Tax=Gossypium australe TaxID=47621 RepID=A0A5B6UFR2_9ROSI|nr:protein ENHANCED DISEASE RESISTANCE 2-like isoform X1 [Gossypium australe]